MIRPGGGVRLALVLSGWGGVWASAALAFEVTVAGPGESLPVESRGAWNAPASAETLLAAFRLTESLEEERHAGEGIPATLFLVVDLWQEKGGWWDSLIRSQALVYRFQIDVWSGAVELRDLDGSIVRLPDRASLRAHLERVHEVLLGTPRDFEPGRSYYVTVKALLRPMKLEDLEEVDAWLSGRVTGEGGILGIPKTIARLVFGTSGLGDENATGRSRAFVPRPLP